MGNNFKNKNNENLAILIPAHNEEKTICSVITKIEKYLDLIIIINDGSTDNTQREAEKAGAIVLRHNRNLGKGAALKIGFDYILRSFSEVKAVIILDADGQHNPAEIPKFIEVFEQTGADLILGERLINRQEMPFLRRVGNNLASWLISRKLGQKIIDSQTGFRLISKRFLGKLNCKSDSYGIETEILLSASQGGFQIKTIPISTIYSNKKHINFFKDSKIIFSILKIYFLSQMKIIFRKLDFLKTLIVASLIILAMNQVGQALFIISQSQPSNFKYQEEFVRVLMWLKENFKPEDIVLSEWTQGHQIAALAERPVVVTSKVYPSEAKEVAQRYRDLANFFYATSEEKALEIIEKYKVKLVFLRRNNFDWWICRYNKTCQFTENTKGLSAVGQRTILGRMLSKDKFNNFKLVYESDNFMFYQFEPSGEKKYFAGFPIPQINFKNIKPIALNIEATGGVLPHDTRYAESLINNFFATLSVHKKFESFVVLGPDHYGLVKDRIAVSSLDWETPLGQVEADKFIIERLLGSGLAVNDETVNEYEHSVRVIVPYIKYWFPKAKIVPVVVGNSVDFESAEEFGRMLGRIASDKVFILVSVDFAHKFNYEETLTRNQKAIEILSSQSSQQIISSLTADARPALVVLNEAMSQKKADKLWIFKNSNNLDLMREGLTDKKNLDYLVGYLSLIFYK